MDISRVTLEGEALDLFNQAGAKSALVKTELDSLQDEYKQAIDALNAVKAKIRPLKAELSPLAELQASIASRRSRTKYFPQFATRNFDDSKDVEFLEFVRQQLPPDKE